MKKPSTFAIKEDKRPLIPGFPEIIRDRSLEELTDVESKAKADFNAQVNLEDIFDAPETADGKKKKRKASYKTIASAPAKKNKKAEVQKKLQELSTVEIMETRTRSDTAPTETQLKQTHTSFGTNMKGTKKVLEDPKRIKRMLDKELDLESDSNDNRPLSSKLPRLAKEVAKDHSAKDKLEDSTEKAE